MTRACRDNNSGVILIALLWILTALSVIALSFSREGFIEVAAARNTRDLADSYYVARAGLMTTVYRLMQRQLSPALQQLELQSTPDPIDLGTVTGTFGDGEYVVEIQDESGKINLNFVVEEQLRALLDAVSIPKHDADIIADSLLDWKDTDQDHRLNGAEDDYYQSLNPPYKAKNGRLDTVEELLLVRGVTEDYFYGHSEKSPDGSIVYKYGLSRYLTVYSTTNRVNINYAPFQVLMAIPGMTPQMAQAISERRKVKPFANLNEITQQLAVTIGATTLPFLSTDRTGIYTLTVKAHRENSKANRAIRAVVNTMDAREANRYKIIYWNENVPNL
jgi:general secretion pathway protein K